MVGIIPGIVAFIGAHPAWANLVIAITAFGESFAFLSLLFPGTAILIAAGALCSMGVLNPVTAALAGIVGAVSGDSFSFWLGQKFGPRIANIWPFTTRPQWLTRGDRFFAQYGGASVFIGRFFGPLRAIVPLTAGMLHMPTAQFYIANVLSAVVWAPTLILFGMFVGRTLSNSKDIETRLILVALAIACVVILARWARTRSRRL